MKKMTEREWVTRKPPERDYLERTIATVRVHQDADNCWPQWANIFADEIERLWAENARLHAALQEHSEEIPA